MEEEKTAASIQTFHLCGWAGHHGEQVQRFFLPPRCPIVAMETGTIILAGVRNRSCSFVIKLNHQQ